MLYPYETLLLAQIQPQNGTLNDAFRTIRAEIQIILDEQVGADTKVNSFV
jgi:hypothetical protein